MKSEVQIKVKVSNKHTPWGYSDSAIQLAEGIISYSTPSHGGIHVSSLKLAAMPADCRAVKTYNGDIGWYEEDCDWAIVCLAFPEAFDPEHYKFAVETLKSYHPELLTPERLARAEAWTAANADKWAQGCAGTHDEGWFVNVYNVADPEKSRSKVFPGIPVLPAVFTLEQFENAPMYRG